MKFINLLIYFIAILAINIYAQPQTVNPVINTSLIAYDGFDNTIVGECITNVYSGVGFMDSWTGIPANNGSFPADENVIVEGLNYSTNGINLITKGNAGLTIPSDAGTTDKGFNLNRMLDTSLTNKTTIWTSILLKPILQFDTCGIFLSFGNGEGPAFGEHWNVSWRFVNGNAIGPAVVVDQTYFIVVKYVLKDGDDTAYMYINPDLSKEPTEAEATGVQVRSMAFGDNINWRVVHNHAGTERSGLVFDEFRLGDSWNDVVKVDIPTNIEASKGTYSDKIDVSWQGPDNATSYDVYRATNNNFNEANKIAANLSTNNYADDSVTSLITYYYWVVSDINETPSASDSGYSTGVLPPTPLNLVASQGTISNAISLVWEPSSNTTKYAIYRNKIEDFDTAILIDDTLTTNTYLDSAIKIGANYTYWVVNGNNYGWSLPSDPALGYTEYSGICYEDFDYPIGSDLNGQQGGSGLKDAWSVSGGGKFFIAEGLTYLGLQTSGNSAVAMGISPTGTALFGNRSSKKEFGGATNTFWYSCLFKLYDKGNGGTYLIPNNSNDGSIGRYWSDYICLYQKPTEVPLEYERTYLLVSKSSPEGIFLWVDPSLENEPLNGSADASYDSTITAGNDIKIKVTPYPIDGTNAFYYDEIRFGNTWDDVTPNYLVKNVQATDGTYNDKVTITWSLRSDATSYVVYRGTENDSSKATAISSDLTTDSYDDTSSNPGEIYYYWIWATFDDGQQAFSYNAHGYKAATGAPLPPANLVASDAVPDQKYINITFDVSAGATGYRILRNTTDDYAAAENISGDILGNRYLDYSVKAGVKYYYWVRAQNANGWSNFGDSDSGSMPAILIAYYAMDELTSTNMLDSSENEFNGIYRDEPILGIPSADAELFKTAVQFSVSDATINSNTPIRDLTNNFTVAMWVNPEEISDSEYRYLIGLRSEVGGWSVQIYKDEVLLDITGKGSGWTTAEAVAVDQWNHIAFSFDNNNEIRSFVNGVPREQSTKIGMPADYVKSTTYIANGALDTLYFGGLDEIRVYNGVLTDEGIAELAGVPEPTTILLVATMLLGLLFRRNR